MARARQADVVPALRIAKDLLTCPCCYGFIDPYGKMIIPPNFDYATQFVEGFALVYLDGQPLFINSEGKTAFQSVYQLMTPFSDGLSHVRTFSGKSGVINKNGELVVDTLYEYISPFRSGVAIAQGLHHQDNFGDKSRT